MAYLGYPRQIVTTPAASHLCGRLDKLDVGTVAIGNELSATIAAVGTLTADEMSATSAAVGTLTADEMSATSAAVGTLAADNATIAGDITAGGTVLSTSLSLANSGSLATLAFTGAKITASAPVESPALNITTAALGAAAAAGALVAGAVYRITDFVTRYYFPTITPETLFTSATVEVLRVTAASGSTLAPTAISETFPQDILFFSLVAPPAILPTGAYGLITRRISQTYGIDMPCDWRGARARRFKHATHGYVCVWPQTGLENDFVDYPMIPAPEGGAAAARGIMVEAGLDCAHNYPNFVLGVAPASVAAVRISAHSARSITSLAGMDHVTIENMDTSRGVFCLAFGSAPKNVAIRGLYKYGAANEMYLTGTLTDREFAVENAPTYSATAGSAEYKIVDTRTTTAVVAASWSRTTTTAGTGSGADVTLILRRRANNAEIEIVTMNAPKVAAGTTAAFLDYTLSSTFAPLGTSVGGGMALGSVGWFYAGNKTVPATMFFGQLSIDLSGVTWTGTRDLLVFGAIRFAADDDPSFAVGTLA